MWYVIDENTCRVWDCPQSPESAQEFAEELRKQGFEAVAVHCRLLGFDETIVKPK